MPGLCALFRVCRWLGRHDPLWYAGAFVSFFFSFLFDSRRVAAVGSGYGTAKSGASIAGIGTFKPELVMKALIPVVMAGIIAIYGLVVAVLISSTSTRACMAF